MGGKEKNRGLQLWRDAGAPIAPSASTNGHHRSFTTGPNSCEKLTPILKLSFNLVASRSIKHRNPADVHKSFNAAFGKTLTDGWCCSEGLMRNPGLALLGIFAILKKK